ncbi:MAG: hypothetical protein ACYDA7_05265 [Acidithiobacillus sp.]
MWHHAYYGHSTGLHPAWGSWLGHTIVRSAIHGLIYGAIFNLMRGMRVAPSMGTGEVLLVAGGVAIIGAGWWLRNRRRA